MSDLLTQRLFPSSDVVVVEPMAELNVATGRLRWSSGLHGWKNVFGGRPLGTNGSLGALSLGAGVGWRVAPRGALRDDVGPQRRGAHWETFGSENVGDLGVGITGVSQGEEAFEVGADGRLDRAAPSTRFPGGLGRRLLEGGGQPGEISLIRIHLRPRRDRSVVDEHIRMSRYHATTYHRKLQNIAVGSPLVAEDRRHSYLKCLRLRSWKFGRRRTHLAMLFLRRLGRAVSKIQVDL